MELGEYLNRYLNEHNLSFREFGKLSNISHTYIANIVNGQTSRGNKPVLSYKKLKQIASGMGKDIDELLAEVDVDIEWGERSKIALTDEEQHLILWYRSATEFDRGRVYSILEVYEKSNTDTSTVSA